MHGKRSDDFPSTVYSHLFRHQIITFFTRTGIISPVKLILLSGHAEEKSLAMQCDLAQADVAEEHQKAMRVFPVRETPLLFSIAASLASPPIVAPCRTQK